MNNQLQELLKLTTAKLGYVDIFLNFLVCLISTYFIIYLYNRFSSTVADKSYFSRIFPIFSISIFLIITVIQSSLALSLGLVGALSIIRFRTAIKEPEQLVYLLMITGVAISSAAGQYRAGLIGTLLFGAVVLFESQWIKRRRYSIAANTGVLVVKTNLSVKQSEIEDFFEGIPFRIISYNSSEEELTYTYSLTLSDISGIESKMKETLDLSEFYYTVVS